MNSVRHWRQWRCLTFLLVFLTHSEVTGEPNLNTSPNETNSTQSSHGIKALAGQSCSLYVLKKTWRCGQPNGGWQYELNSALSECVYKVTEKLSWFSARENCINHGGVLLAPKSPFTSLTAGYNEMGKDYIYWLGYHDHDEEGCFVPHYDSSRDCIDVNSTKKTWYSGGPDDDGGNQNCIAIGYKNKPLLDDQVCHDKALSVCALEDVPDTSHSVEFQIQEEDIIMGGTFRLSFTYRFERYVDDYRITVENARGELFHWTESPKYNDRRYYRRLQPDQNAIPGEHVDAYGEYAYDTPSASKKIKRCMGSKKFNMRLVARKANEKIVIRIQLDNTPDLMRTFGVVIAYKPLFPTIADESEYTRNSLIITLKCLSTVAMEGGAITWIMRQKDGVNRTWIVGAEDEIIERNPHKRISITVEEDTKQSDRSRDSGRHIITTMTIDFKMPFQMSVVDCYSYNKELPWIDNSTSFGPEQLKYSHIVDYKNLGINVTEDMLKSITVAASTTVDYQNLGINVTEDMLKSITVAASTESGDEGSSNVWYSLLALFILAGVAGIGTALVANKKNNNKDGAGDGPTDQDADKKEENKDARDNAILQSVLLIGLTEDM